MSRLYIGFYYISGNDDMYNGQSQSPVGNKESPIHFIFATIVFV